MNNKDKLIQILMHYCDDIFLPMQVMELKKGVRVYIDYYSDFNINKFLRREKVTLNKLKISTHKKLKLDWDLKSKKKILTFKLSYKDYKKVLS